MKGKEMLDSKKEIGRKIWDYFARGYSYGQIAGKLKISKSVVSNIINYTLPAKDWCNENLKKLKENYEREIQQKQQTILKTKKKCQEEQQEIIKKTILTTAVIATILLFFTSYTISIFFNPALLVAKFITRPFYIKSILTILFLLTFFGITYLISKKLIDEI